MIDMGFWGLAFLLGLLAAVFVLFPLLHRPDPGADPDLRRASNLAIFAARLAEIRADQEAGEMSAGDAGTLERELELGLLRDVGSDEQARPVVAPGEGAGLLLGAAVAAPLLALVLYADWGLALGALPDLTLAEEAQRLAAVDLDDSELRAIADRLAARLKREPGKIAGWFLLGRAHLRRGDFAEAATAFEEASHVVPGSLAPRVFQAQALYLADDQVLTRRVGALVGEVLQRDPEQPLILELLATDAFRNQRFAQAAELFAQVLAINVGDESRRRFLMDAWARSRELAGLTPTPAPAAAAAGSLLIFVELAKGLAPAPQAPVLVFARSVDEPSIPLAVARLSVAELPALVTLDDSLAMIPGHVLSVAARVELVARITSSDAMAGQPDDLEGRLGPLAPKATHRVLPLRIGRAVQ